MHRTVCVYVTHESESFLYSLLFRKQSQKLDLKVRGEGTLEVGKERDSHLDKWIRGLQRSILVAAFWNLDLGCWNNTNTTSCFSLLKDWRHSLSSLEEWAQEPSDLDMSLDWWELAFPSLVHKHALHFYLDPFSKPSSTVFHFSTPLILKNLILGDYYCPWFCSHIKCKQ